MMILRAVEVACHALQSYGRAECQGLQYMLWQAVHHTHGQEGYRHRSLHTRR